jgi:adenylate kinase
MKDSSKGRVSREEDGKPMMQRLMIMGPPGVGKGTQAELIQKTLDLYHLSTGNILREAVQKGTPLGLKVKSYLDSGDLVPDEVVGEIIEEKLKEDRVKERFLLDGFPRTERQVEILDEILLRLQEKLDAAFLIYLDEGRRSII